MGFYVFLNSKGSRSKGRSRSNSRSIGPTIAEVKDQDSPIGKGLFWCGSVPLSHSSASLVPMVPLWKRQDKIWQ